MRIVQHDGECLYDCEICKSSPAEHCMGLTCRLNRNAIKGQNPDACPCICDDCQEYMNRKELSNTGWFRPVSWGVGQDMSGWKPGTKEG